MQKAAKAARESHLIEEQLYTVGSPNSGQQMPVWRPTNAGVAARKKNDCPCGQND
jgi:hypothetical protein